MTKIHDVFVYTCRKLTEEGKKSNFFLQTDKQVVESHWMTFDCSISGSLLKILTTNKHTGGMAGNILQWIQNVNAFATSV